MPIYNTALKDMKQSVFGLFILICLFFSCTHPTSNSETGGDTISLRHARYLTLVRYSWGVMATVKNPWKEHQVLSRYAIIDTAYNHRLPQWGGDVCVIPAPVSRSVVMSSVHLALFEIFDKQNAVIGVCDVPYIKDRKIIHKIRQGKIVDCGSSMTPNIEDIIAGNADAIWMSSFDKNTVKTRLNHLAVPLIECADYMETTPLGRAEWIKFYGILLGKYDEAERYFDKVEHRYLQLVALKKQRRRHPVVMVEKLMYGVWYTPGGCSLAAQMIEDAGGSYIYGKQLEAGDKPLYAKTVYRATDSKALTFEQVLVDAKDADIWLLKYYATTPLTYAKLKAENTGYQQFKPFQNKKIWACNTAETYFYEETPFQPHILLGELIDILYPGAVKKNFRYYQPLR